MNKRTRYSPEVRELTVRMVLEHERDYSSSCYRIDILKDWMQSGDSSHMGTKLVSSIVL